MKVYPPLPSTHGDVDGVKGENFSFPVRLHHLLDALQHEGLAHLASWQPHGRSFVVYNPDQFAQQVLPIWFKQTRFGSFQRQLNLYGFKRLKQGRDKGGYWHESFVRGFPHLAHEIKRSVVKKSQQRESDDDEQDEPNFYSIPFVPIAYPTPLLRTTQLPPAPIWATTPAYTPASAKPWDLFHCPCPSPASSNGLQLDVANFSFDAEDMPMIPRAPPATNHQDATKRMAPQPTEMAPVLGASINESFLDFNVPLLQAKLSTSPSLEQPMTMTMMPWYLDAASCHPQDSTTSNNQNGEEIEDANTKKAATAATTKPCNAFECM